VTSHKESRVDGIPFSFRKNNFGRSFWKGGMIMTIIPVFGIIGAVSLFAVIFLFVRWFVKKQWYAFLSVLCAHMLLSYLLSKGWLPLPLSQRELQLMITTACGILVLVKLLEYKKKKRTVY
jgi:hypothetical protein